MATPYDHITKTDRRGSGISDYLLVAPVSSFTTIGCSPKNGTAPTDVVISADHVFNGTGTQGFIKIKMAQGAGEMMANFTGQAGSLKMTQEVKGFIPGSDKPLHSFFQNALNDEWVILVKDSSCSQEMYYQLGCDCNFAAIKGEGGFGTGKLKDGTKGYTVTFEYVTEGIQVYEGAITLAP